jgi:hypothetical protein
MFTHLDAQLTSRLIAKEEGIWLPQGNDRKFIKYANNQAEQVHMMILLQCTQMLEANEWRECREVSYMRFGRDKYKALVQERDYSPPKCPAPAIQRFTMKSIMFGAIKEEETGIALEWKERLQDVYESV